MTKVKYLFTILLLSGALLAEAQKLKPVKDEIIPEQEKSFEKVENQACYPKGEMAWVRFVQNNFDLAAIMSQFPDSVLEYKDSMYVRFIVDKKGTITDPVATPCHTPGFREAIFLLLKKSPAWTPALQTVPVKSYVCYLFTCWWVADYGGIMVRRTKFPGD